MSDEQLSTPAEVPVQPSLDEIERLRIENEALRQQMAEQAAEHNHPQRWRWPVAALLLVIGLAFILVSIPAVWVNRTIMNTDQWAATVGPLADDPAIQDAVATQLNARVLEKLDAQARVRELLPDQLDLLAAPIAAQIEGFVSQAIDSIVRSDQFAEIWKELAIAAQKGFVAGITGGGKGGVVSTQSGIVAVNTSPIVDRVQKRVESGKLSAISQYVPWGSLDTTVVLAESPGLARMQQVFAALNTLVWLLPLIGFALAGGGVAAAPNRRKAWLWLGIGLVVVGVLPLFTLTFLQGQFVTGASASLGISAAATTAFWETVLRFLITMFRSAAAIGIIVTLAAFLAGPARVSVWFRHGLGGGLSGLGGERFGKFGALVAAHKPELRIVGVVVGVLWLVASAPLTPKLIFGVAIAVGVWLLLIELFGGTQGRPASPPSDPA